MHWNHRLFKQDTPPPATEPHIYFVGECYYDEKGAPELHSSMDYNGLMGDTEEDIKEAYGMLGEAFKAPVIELDKDGNFK